VSVPERVLVVNADDFGQSAGINRGVIVAHRSGIVTSASLMVRWPRAAEAVRLAGEHRGLGLGLHFDAGEWWFDGAEWRPLYRVVSTDDEEAVRGEARRQLDTFRELTGRDPTHLDSHQHVHRSEPVQTVLAGIASELGIPLRHEAPGIEYRGDFYGQTGKGAPMHQDLTVGSLLRVLRTLPVGVTELGCHPAEVADVVSTYRSERTKELDVLCDARVRRAARSRGIRLCTFADLGGPPPRPPGSLRPKR